jgi:hypothetical protein
MIQTQYSRNTSSRVTNVTIVIPSAYTSLALLHGLRSTISGAQKRGLPTIWPSSRISPFLNNPARPKSATFRDLLDAQYSRFEGLKKFFGKKKQACGKLTSIAQKKTVHNVHKKKKNLFVLLLKPCPCE